MDIISILLLAVGLSLDAFAVSIANGVAGKKTSFNIDTALILGLFFGGFQVLMPIIGWLAGMGLRHFISSIDHWIAFALLLGVGGKMIFEAIHDRHDHDESKDKDPSTLNLAMLFLLAIATSIDALAVGLSLSFLEVSIWLPVIIIGLTTFTFSFVGVHIGKKVGSLLESKAEFIGGLILIGIGIKILIEHLK